MSHGRRSVVLYALCLLGCSSSDFTLTERDALDLGYEAVECRGRDDIQVYVDDGAGERPEWGCDQVQLALQRVRSEGVLPVAALADDSIAAAVVWHVRYARAPSAPEAGREGTLVTLDLAGRGFNLIVALEPLPGEATVEQVPKGLRY